MIHIYTGNGKGKTTSALGLAVRAKGQGLKVIIFQFLKPKSIVSGEEKFLKDKKGIKIVKFCQKHPIFSKDKAGFGKLAQTVERDFEKIENAVLSGKYDMIVLDEAVNCVDQSLICKDRFLKLLKSAPKNVELVLTGRGDISGIEEFSDYITIMTEKKHPFASGKPCRRGIEY